MTPEQEYDARHAKEMSEENIQMMIAEIDQAEKVADGEFNQNEYFQVLSTLRTAKLIAQTPAAKQLVEDKLAELNDRYGRLGSH